MKNFAVAAVFAVWASIAHADSAKLVAGSHTGSRTLAVGQGNHVLESVNGLLAVNPEFMMLISLGTIFMGTAIFFSLRRPSL